MIKADASCAPCLYLLKRSSLFLKEFTVGADISSSGSAFHAFTTLLLKKFTPCSMLFFSLGLHTFMLFPLVSAFSLNVKNCSQFTLSYQL